MSFTRDPNFGRDPWLNDATRPPVVVDALPTEAGRTLYTGADTIADAIRLLPNGLDMYASYVDNYGGYPALVNRFGAGFKGLLLSITIFGNPARCADVEPGAMHPADLPHWLDHVALKDAGQLPWVYTSASNLSAVNSYIGNRRVIRWSAHYGFGPHVCGPRTCGYPQADWTQWADTGPQGQNYDRSVGYVLPVHVTPPPPAGGVARADVHVNLSNGEWKVYPQPGHNVHFGQKNVWWEAKVGINYRTGAWRISPLPVENKLTSSQVSKSPKAGGVAQARVEIDLHNGQWHVTPLPGQVVLGKSDVWWEAKVGIHYQNGVWRISPLPVENKSPVRSFVDKLLGRS